MRTCGESKSTSDRRVHGVSPPPRSPPWPPRACFLFSVDLPPNRESKMVLCLLCFDDAPIDDDPRAVFAREWETGLQLSLIHI